MNNSNEPWSDQWRRQALRANELDAAATILEESKTAILAQRKAALGDIPDNKAEKIVKASPSWEDYIKKMVNARTAANEAKIETEWLRMKYYENASDRADERTVARF